MLTSTLWAPWGRRDVVEDPPGKAHCHKSHVEMELVSVFVICCVCYLLWLTKKIQLLSFLNFLEVTEVSKTVAGGILGDARLGSHICQESLLAGELAVIIKFSCQRADSLHCWVLPRHSTTKWNFCHELEIILKYVLFWVPKDPCRKKMKIYTA